MGEFQQELSEILKAQGSFISETGNSLLNAGEEGGEEEDEEATVNDEMDEMEAEDMPEGIKSIVMGKLRNMSKSSEAQGITELSDKLF